MPEFLRVLLHVDAVEDQVVPLAVSRVVQCRGDTSGVGVPEC